MARQMLNEEDRRKPTSFTLGRPQRETLESASGTLQLTRSALLERLLDLVEVGEISLETVAKAPLIVQQRRSGSAQ